MESVPSGVNLGLGCGNPVSPASLREGEVVLDLGSGDGFDCFLAAIESAGFKDVTGMSEDSFDIHCLANDPATQALSTDLKLSTADFESIDVSVRSVKIQAVKP